MQLSCQYGALLIHLWPTLLMYVTAVGIVLCVSKSHKSRNLKISLHSCSSDPEAMP